jgi:hypothetical protein
MVISLRKSLRLMKYLIVFIMLAYSLYKVLGFLDVALLPMDKYRTPEGSAVKAFHAGSMEVVDPETPLQRLKLFFWYGE